MPDDATLIWSGFYKKALRERQNQLRLIYPELFESSQEIASVHNKNTINGTPRFPINGLDEVVADNMVENCIGTLGLPVGLGLNIVINGQSYVVPMAVEEPSIIAAVSNAAKTMMSAVGGGFLAEHSESNIMIAQIQVLDIDNIDLAEERLLNSFADLIKLGNEYCPTMRERGGGVVGLRVRRVYPHTHQPNGNHLHGHQPNGHHHGDDHSKQSTNGDHGTRIIPTRNRSPYLVLHVHVDVCEAMGANVVNTIAEGMSGQVAALVGGRVGLRILSNLAHERMAKSSFKIDINQLAYKSYSGQQVADGILEAYHFALDDPYRAATSNKGVMNGVDAVAIATGQDWRAIEAAAHAHVCLSQGRYSSMTHYWMEQHADGTKFLCGTLELPMPVGTRGGVLQTNPVYRYLFGLMNFPQARTLAMIIVTIGLAQNFGALRSLATEGIQRGHMSLHARNIAISAGTPPHAIPEVTSYMVNNNRISFQSAQAYLHAHELHSTLHKQQASGLTSKPPSVFYFEESASSAQNNERVILNVVFETLGERPVNLELTERAPRTPLQKALLGDKEFAWLTGVFSSLGSIRLLGARSMSASQLRSNEPAAKKLKLLSVLLNIVTRQMMIYAPEETNQFVHLGLAAATSPSSSPHLSPLLSPVSMPESVGVETKPVLAGALSLPLTGIFQRELLAHIINQSNEILRVGLPLLLALWQVFEINAMQAVGQQALLERILSEQRRIMRALVRPYPLSNPQHLSHQTAPIEWMPFAKFIDLHKTRFQATLFLLCDTMSMDPSDLTTDRLSLLVDVGRNLEWIGIVCHDALHIKRDLHLGNPNSGLVWIAEKYQYATFAMLVDHVDRDDTKLANEFLEATDNSDAIEALLQAWPDGPVDPTLVYAAIALIRSHYHVDGTKLFASKAQ